MRVIVFASQKGGSGKTTLVGHLAVQAERDSAGPVALIDTDPQGSLSAWWNVRESERPLFIQTVFAKIITEIPHLAELGVKLVMIDTPPALTIAIRDVIAYADLVVIPTRPSPHDLRSVGATLDLVEDAGKPLAFIVNGANARARITGEAAIALSQHGVVSPVIVHHRTDFATSMIDGRTVMELDPNSRSAAEMADLWAYLEKRLEKAPSNGLVRRFTRMLAN
jgi:chromosome partitioning protein